MDKNIPDYFGAILERVRKQEGRSLKDLAEVLGKDENEKYYITPSYLNRLEKGEKENPSFKIVCLMIEKLGLNPAEVFKSFGFEDIFNKGHKNESDDIRNIIRMSDIKVPVDEKGDIKSYLTQQEKECLIGIIDEALNYSICSDETYYIEQVIGELYHFRAVRENHLERKMDINGEEITIYLSIKAKNEMDSIHINDEEIYNAVSRLSSKLLEKKDYFIIIDNEIGVNILMNRSEKNFYIKHVIGDIEHQ